ncbi:MAG: DUF177 domain-containing protein [Selenomonadaceae bacterium]|nr:DUF177 domain-containing protein [Selenomonadaceae bacterium]
MNMLVNIAELLGQAGGELPFAFAISPAELDVQSKDCEFEDPVRASGTVVNTGTVLRVGGQIHAVKHFVCDRCCKPCTEPQEHPFAEDFRRGRGDTDEVNSFDGDVLDLAALVRDTLLAAQPLSNICKPDCKGLCPVCGHDLNEGDCGCDRFVPDPRLAALQQLKLDD